MIEIIQKLIPLLGLASSIYIYFLYLSQKEDIDSIQKDMKIYEKYITQNENNIKSLNQELKKIENRVSNMSLSYISDKEEIEKQLFTLFERWTIISDSRITSLPRDFREWFEAKEIVAQKKQKEWKAKNLSQSKNSFVNENAKYNNEVENEEEINQNFSEFSNEDFENIIDKDEEDSSSSGATDNTQNRKLKTPKQKSNQIKSNQIKM